MSRALSIFLCICVLTACGGGSGSSAAPAVAPSSPPLTGNLLPPAGQIYLGAYANAGGAGIDPTQQLAALETQIGRKFALSMHYHGWNGVFPAADEADDAQAGRVPVISWNCGASNAQVAAGSQDSVIASHADAIKAYGRPVFLRYMWEMNNPGGVLSRQQCYDPSTDEPNGVFSPEQFIAAWMHIRAIFAAHGVANVVWLWNPSGDGGNSPTRYYPGSAEVDWIGIDQYDRTNVSFDKTFTLYDQLTGYNKPILIAETGALAGNQAAFLSGAASLQTAFPLVRGFMYFDSPGLFGWQFTSDGVAAFVALAANPYFAAPAP